MHHARFHRAAQVNYKGATSEELIIVLIVPTRTLYTEMKYTEIRTIEILPIFEEIESCPKWRHDISTVDSKKFENMWFPVQKRTPRRNTISYKDTSRSQGSSRHEDRPPSTARFSGFAYSRHQNLPQRFSQKQRPHKQRLHRSTCSSSTSYSWS